MVTSNLTANRTWVEIPNPFSVSNSSSVEVEVWVGTVAPTAQSVGHLLSWGKGITMDTFDTGDRLWVRSYGISLLTVTSKS